MLSLLNICNKKEFSQKEISYQTAELDEVSIAL